MIARPEVAAAVQVPSLTTLLELCEMIARTEQDSKRLPAGTCVELFCHLGLALAVCDEDYHRACAARAWICVFCICSR